MTLIKGRYRIIETIGRGGFGETYLTIDEDLPSKRTCVVKQLKPQRGVITDEMKARFEQEARVREMLGNKHDRIPKLFAHFEDGGEFYLVQEYIPGKTVGQLIKEGKTADEAYVRDFLLEILPVVEFIHSKKIIHRDIKPHNIIIRESDGKPVLIDFGVVKQMMDSEVVSMTVGAGTMEFMAIEQMQGNPTKGSDLYSLGKTAIAMLTPGYQLKPDSQTGEIYWKNLVKGGLSGELGEILDKATELLVRDRYKTAGDFFSALKNGQAANENNPKPFKVEETEEYRAGFEEAYQTGKDHALAGNGYYLELGFRGVINLRNADAGRTGEKAGWFDQGYREGFRKGFLAGGGAIVDEDAFEPISWKNLKPGRKLYAAGRYEATVVFVEPSRGLIYVEFPSGSKEYKSVNAVANFWSVKRAEVEIDPV
jgi:serine/threonine protein kinase